MTLLLRFWFRFIFPSTSCIRHMGTNRALRDLIRPHLDAYYGHCFERLCREALPHLYRKEGVTAGFVVGEYWSKDVQVDVVGVRNDNWIDLGECKWGPTRSPAALDRELDQKARAYPNPQGATIGRRIFTRQAPPEKGRGEGGWGWRRCIKIRTEFERDVMGTLSLRLPNSLHKQLRELAKREGISINQFIS